MRRDEKLVSDSAIVEPRWRPPPIYLATRSSDYTKFSNVIKKDIGDNFSLKFLGNQIKIQFHQLSDYSDFRKLAAHKGYAYHTYSFPEECSITVTLKGLPNIGAPCLPFLQEGKEPQGKDPDPE